MLSYRHAFHAGNHADVLKHAVVTQLLDYLTQKDKPFWYIDTHSGAGLYALDHEWAQKKAEFDTGIGPLWRAAAAGEPMPALLDAYLDQVRELNPKGDLKHYPGSPWPAWQMLRDADRLRLFELHSTEIKVLSNNFRGAGRRVMLYDGDGFAGIKAILPPPPRRARGARRRAPPPPARAQGRGRRPVHEPDPHLRTRGRQSVRLPHRTAAAGARTGGRPARSLDHRRGNECGVDDAFCVRSDGGGPSGGLRFDQGAALAPKMDADQHVIVDFDIPSAGVFDNAWPVDDRD